MPNQPTETTVRRLTCACCGAGCRGRQWWNRDTGFGVCRGCVDRMLLRGIPYAEIQNLYGTCGVHFDVPGENTPRPSGRRR